MSIEILSSMSNEFLFMGSALRHSLKIDSFAGSSPPSPQHPSDAQCRFTSSLRWLSTHTFPSSNTCVFLHTGQSNCIDFLITGSIIMSSGGGERLELTAANVAMQQKQNRWVHESATGFLSKCKQMAQERSSWCSSCRRAPCGAKRAARRAALVYNSESFLEVKKIASPTRLSYPARELTNSRVFSSVPCPLLLLLRRCLSDTQGQLLLQYLELS
mmetsp:Transcript_15516/g.33584  ORF Transcript_15516/g.33584 Transcript_15516/m.33584 type:complete len:215 (-) Transcript_15516:691-1335(-)